MGMCEAELRLPLAPMANVNKEQLKAVLKKYELI